MKNLKKFEGVFEELPESWEPDAKSMGELAEYIARRLEIDFDLDVEGLPYNNAFVIMIGKRPLNGVLSNCGIIVDDHQMQISISHANDTKLWEIDVNETVGQFSSWEDVYDELHPVAEHWFNIDREVRRMQRETQDKFYELPEVESPSVQKYLQQS